MLKSLELFGFKSFADRTRLDFARGITCVVGPNGSGKSNVVDAIKWILGDQSPKSLRGKEMTDVIFNGATGRKPSGFAEATLTFDNSNGFLPVESREVQIGRRLWRNGDSEYLINRNPARLKDIRDLFMGTGAGSSAYSIIEQGRVAQILQANASARRAVFEEAAGVSRYKARKADAERKLERVAQNLLRLTDIVDEVEAQLNSVRSQAAKAARYRELSDELRRWWVGLTADDARHRSDQKADLQQQGVAHQQAIEQLNEQRLEMEQRLSAVEVEITDADDRIRTCERSAASFRAAIATKQATVTHQTNRWEELDADLVRLQQQRRMMARRTIAIDQELDSATAEANQFREEFDQRCSTLAAADEEIAQTKRRIGERKSQVEAARAHILQLTRNASVAGQQSETYRSQRIAAQEAVTDTQQELADLEEDLATQQADVQRKELACQESRAHVAELEQQLAALTQRQEELAAERHTCVQQLSEMREQRSASAARIGVLEDLESRQEGLGIGVKEILSRAHTSRHPPWNSILGSVADLLDTELENAALLEVALGPQSQLVVIRDLNLMMDYLAGGHVVISGRVGFLELHDETRRSTANQNKPSVVMVDPEDFHPGNTTPSADRSETDSGSDDTDESDDDEVWVDTLIELPEDFPDPPSVASAANLPADAPQTIGDILGKTTTPYDLRGREGVVTRADDLVQPASNAPGLARQLLADTWIVDSFETAKLLAAETGDRFRFVTLQGERLEQDGTVYVGTVRAEAALVSRRSELRRLKLELQRLDDRIATSTESLDKLESRLDSADSDRGECRREYQAARDRDAEYKAAYSDSQQQLTRLREDRQRLQAELARKKNECLQLDEAIEASERDRHQHEEQLRSSEAEIVKHEQRVLELTAELEHQQADRDKFRLDLAKQEERVTALDERKEQLLSEKQLRMQQREEVERRFLDAVGQRRKIVLQILNTRAKMDEDFLHQEDVLRESRELQRRKNVMRTNRSELLGRDTQIRNERRQRSEELHRCEMQIRDIDHQISSIAERLDEEYQMTVDEAVQSGASAVALLLQERDEQIGGRGSTATRNDDEPQATSPEDEDSTEIDAPEDLSDDTVDVAEDEEADLADNIDAVEDEQGDAEEESTAETAQSSLPVPDAEAYHLYRDEIEQRVARLRKKLKMMGHVNPESLNDLDELERRHGHLAAQLSDLVEAKTTLEDIVRRINHESRRMFQEAFESIRENFRELFRQLFGGGEADVVLEDPDDLLDCGIEILARPPGKELRSITLLSGGEKTLTAVALLLAIFRSRPSPFCILDEVDAALDEANVERFANVVKEFEDTTQFIMITHNKRSMTVATVMYGVTMEQSGVSKKMSVQFEDVSEDGEIRASAKSTDEEAAA